MRFLTAAMSSIWLSIYSSVLAFLSDGWTGMSGLITSCSLFSLWPLIPTEQPADKHTLHDPFKFHCWFMTFCLSSSYWQCFLLKNVKCELHHLTLQYIYVVYVNLKERWIWISLNLKWISLFIHFVLSLSLSLFFLFSHLKYITQLSVFSQIKRLADSGALEDT